MNRFSYIKKSYPGVLLLGWVSFFTDIASEMLYPLTPIFLTSIIGTSMASVGLIEGVAEGLASLLKTYSGFWSDKISRRKPFLILGYFLSAISRPLIGLSTTSIHVFAVRCLDRTGKGLRTAPRDALIADMVPPADRGLAFGWHRSIDTMGAVFGPLLAILVLKYFTDLRGVFFWAVIPSVLSVALIFLIKEKKSSPTASSFKFQWKALTPEYRNFLLGWTVFCVTNSSDAFIILKMKTSGMSLTSILSIYAFYNLIYAALSPGLGRFADRLGDRKVLIFGLIFYFLAYLGFSMAQVPYHFILLFSLYGVFMAATEGVSKSYSSKLADPANKATALGLLGTFTGIAQILASLSVGIVWDHFGSTPALLMSCLGSAFFILWLLMFNKKA